MTLEEVGKKVGVGKSTVRKWESGDIKNMRRDKIALLAAALGVSPGYLMGWEEPEAPLIPAPDPAAPAPELPSDESRLISTYRQLNPEGQDKLLSYADDLLSTGKYIKNTSLANEA